MAQHQNNFYYGSSMWLSENNTVMQEKAAVDETFGHTGFTGTMVWVDPVNYCFVILLTNRVYPSRNQRRLYELNIRPQLLDYVIQD